MKKTWLINNIQAALKIGVRGKLYLALGSIVSLTIAMGVVAWYLFQIANQSLNTISLKIIPSLSTTKYITTTSLQIEAHLPQIMHSPSTTALNEETNEILKFIDIEKKLVQGVKKILSDTKKVDRLYVLINEVEQQIKTIQQQSLALFKLREKKSGQAKIIEQLNYDFAQPIAMLIDKTYSDTITHIEYPTMIASVEFIEKTKKDVDNLKNLLQLQAEGNIMLELLTSALNYPDKTGLMALLERFKVNQKQFKQRVQNIQANNQNAKNFYEAAQRLLTIATSEENSFALRTQELDQIETIFSGAQAIQDHIFEIEKLEDKLSLQISQQALALQLDANKKLNGGKALLIFISLLSVVIAFLIGWLYIGQNVIRRIYSIGASIIKIADGEYHSPILLEGNDEIANMAKAVLVFKKHMLQNEQLNEALRHAKDRAEQANEEIRKMNLELEARVEKRTQDLSLANFQLKETLKEIKELQNEIVAAEKMASLGRLVAGVAHEINTPVGNAVTAASGLIDRIKKINDSITAGKISKKEFKQFMQESNQFSELILKNLARTSDLVANFKQVSVNHTDEAPTLIDVADTLKRIKIEIKQNFEEFPWHVNIDCDPSIVVNASAKAFTQVISRLIVNSIMHGFKKRDSGTITIQCSAADNQFKLIYTDNGNGMDEETIKNLFDPFFTTARSSGRAGLGMHIVYNLVTQKLNGKIRCNSTLGQGVEFVLCFATG